MTFWLRCDAGAQFGLGHAQRLLTLAQALHTQAPAVPLVFVTTTPALQDVVGADWYDWCTQCYDSEWQAIEAVRAQVHPGDGLVVDEPAQGSTMAATWRAKLHRSLPLVRLDAPQAEPDSCDLLILPGLHHAPERVEALDAAFGQRLLVGAEYVMLREDVVRHRRWAWGKHAPSLLVCAGASDPEQALPQLFAMTRDLSTRLLGMIRVYTLGALAPPWPLQHLQGGDWVVAFDLNHLQRAALCVTLWGTTVYEALALGTPTLTIARTDAEAADAARLEAATEGAVQSLGTLSGLMRETLCDRLVALWRDAAQRKRMHHASAGLLDGQGAARVATAMLALTLSSGDALSS